MFSRSIRDAALVPAAPSPLVVKARALLRMGEAAAAREAVHAAVQRGPDHGLAHAAAAAVAAVEGDLEDATRHLTRAEERELGPIDGST